MNALTIIANSKFGCHLSTTLSILNSIVFFSYAFTSFYVIYLSLFNSTRNCIDISSLIQAYQEDYVNKTCESGTSCG